jgi:hypothetical protein
MVTKWPKFWQLCGLKFCSALGFLAEKMTTELFIFEEFSSMFPLSILLKLASL